MKDLTNKQSLKIFFIILVGYVISHIKWIEPVEWGFVFNHNLLEMDSNSWIQSMAGAHSSQFTFTQYLFELGLTKKYVNFIAFFITIFVAFFSVYQIAHIITKSYITSLLTVILMLFVKFDSAHGYGVVFPYNFWSFGQFGTFFSIMTIGLSIRKKYNLSCLCLGLLFGIHLGWFLGSIGFLTIFYLFNKFKFQNFRSNLAVIFIFFIFGLSISLISEKYYKRTLIELDTINNNYNHSSIQDLNFSIDKEYEEKMMSELSLNYKEDSLLTGHNVDLNQVSIINYYKTDIALILFLFLLTFLKKVYIRRFIKPIITLTLLLVTLKLYDTFDPNLDFLRQFGLETLYIRLIPERYFNFNTYFLYVFASAFSIKYIINKKYLTLIIFLFIYLLLKDLLSTSVNYSSKQINYFFIFIIFFAFLKKINSDLLTNFLSPIKNNFSNYINDFKFSIYNSIRFNISIKLPVFNVCLIFIALFTLRWIIESYINKSYLQEPFSKKIYDHLISYDKPLLLGAYVVNYDQSFFPVLDLETTMIVPNNDSFNDYEPFCYYFDRVKFMKWYDAIDECFAVKKESTWKKISKIYNADYLLVPSFYKPINSQLIVEDKGLRLYLIK